MSFTAMVGINDILSTPPRLTPETTGVSRHIGILHAGGLTPGMNTAARTAVRLGTARDWAMFGIRGSWRGLADSGVRKLTWGDVGGWVFQGGTELGTRRKVSEIKRYYSLEQAIKRNELDALVVIGGLNAYLAVHTMMNECNRYPTFQIPVVLILVSIDNNLPGPELSVGTDTTLSGVTWTLDRIEESTAATKHCLIAEIMERRYGYLTLMSSLSPGAEYIYLNEDVASLQKIAEDSRRMVDSLKDGRRLFLIPVSEVISKFYDREFLTPVYETESEGYYDVRHFALGHLQQGGASSPFDRLLVARPTNRALEYLQDQFVRDKAEGVYIGQIDNHIEARLVKNMFDDLDIVNRRPSDQWWCELTRIQRIVSIQDPGVFVLAISIADSEE